MWDMGPGRPRNAIKLSSELITRGRGEEASQGPCDHYREKGRRQVEVRGVEAAEPLNALPVQAFLVGHASSTKVLRKVSG